ncbi:transcriptional regulator, TetR family [Paenibacillus algorifonticola]|uniref:Transcriptional regulator, TetR family n=1 Tax=Paenibacillus algorifonticola TaxID=684063 RepID=A0A1I1YZ37_9BACL|nr:TetR/AcrR family transcriptional regulator [Paenibacillus algorifonticola]SFE24836.1 transcriptional regulator, TetR family [Paenibacillus algorifonticola]
MYRIGNDKRKTQSAILICSGMEELMRTQDYNDISVTQIINVSGVGRATFYRLFDDKSDVVLYQMESVFNELIRRMGPRTDPNVVVKSLFDLCLSHKLLFLSLVKANLYGEFQTQLSFVMGEKLKFIKEDVGLDDRKWQYFIHIRAAMLFTALRVAITQFNEDNSQDILDTLNDLFGKQPAILKS